MNDSNATKLPRRDFLTRSAAITIGAIVGIIPALAGLMVFLDPLRKKNKSVAGAIRVASLRALPMDGLPHKFSVIASRTDAWNKFPEVPVGAVYLRQVSDKRIEALNVVCPHAGCFVDYKAERNIYLCPCHNSAFALDGTIGDPSSPSPRPLDNLEVEIRGEEIWIKFQNFRAGEAKKIPVA